MRLALRLARKGLGRTSPNPAVGAVVAAGGRVVGTGWHRQAGTEHAEVLALPEAGDAARGATLYVTLEPCAHHRRTPPCVEAGPAARRRLRVVVDSLARTPPGARVLDGAAPTLVVVTDSAPGESVRWLREAGAEVRAVAADGGWVSLAGLLGCLAAQGVVSLLMEGGATLAGSFAAAGLIDRYLFYVAPKLLGGGAAPGA